MRRVVFERAERSFILKLLPLRPGITTKAVKDGEEYVINGGKMWTTNGAQADWMCLLANTGDGPPHRNKSLICLPMKLPGGRRPRAHTSRRCLTDRNGKLDVEKEKELAFWFF